MIENLGWILICAVAALGMLVWGTVVAIGTITRERTRREIMAYVAEGAMSPADAARLIEIAEQADLRKKIISDAGWSGNNESYRKTLDQVLGGKPAANAESA